MRKFWLIVVLMLATLFVGCAITDGFMGVKRDAEGNVTEEEGGGPAPINILGMLLGFGEAAAAARWVYTEAAKRKVDKNFKAVVAGVEDAVKTKGLSKDVIYPTITAASELYANRGFFARSVKKVKDAVRYAKDKKTS